MDNISENTWYRLSNWFMGPSLSLEAPASFPGVPGKAIMAATRSARGQLWKLTPQGNDTYRLTSSLLGDGISLEAKSIKQGRRNTVDLVMGKTSSAIGQLWKLIPHPDNDTYRLTNLLLNEKYSIKYVEYVGGKKELFMDKTTDSSAIRQYWRLTSNGSITYTAKDTEKWMSLVSDNALLSQLSLPGTHESMAMYGRNSTCQEWTLLQQLRNGLRVFDIRLRYLPGEHNTNFSIHHSEDYQHAFLDKGFDHTDDSLFFVLDECLSFLLQNPSECIVLLMKQEKSAQNRQTFYDAFWQIINSRGNQIQIDKLFYRGNVVPRLGKSTDADSARGKIVFAFVDGKDDQLTTPQRGLYWGNIDFQVDSTNLQPGQQPGVDVENHWQDSMNEKWGKVVPHLDKALQCQPSNNTWFITYLSASHAPALGWFPKDYATYLLPKLQNYMEGKLAEPPQIWPHGRYFGTVLMDFPNSDVIDKLINASISYQYPMPT